MLITRIALPDDDDNNDNEKDEEARVRIRMYAHINAQILSHSRRSMFERIIKSQNTNEQ